MNLTTWLKPIATQLFIVFGQANGIAARHGWQVSRYLVLACFLFAPCTTSSGQDFSSEATLDRLLKRFPDADANGDGKLTAEEAQNYRENLRGGRRTNRGIKRSFTVDPGWDSERFPPHAVCYQTPEEIKAIFAKASGNKRAIVSYLKPADGAKRVVGIGHSFMAPGYKTLPIISAGAGMKQPLHIHLGGGMTGSARYKWEQENGIFGFDGKPFPKLLASIANAQWDAMMFGPYYQDRPVYYSCWFDFCLKYNPEMKFYLSDAWPQLEQLPAIPESESSFTEDTLQRWGDQKNASSAETFEPLRKAYPDRVFVMPTSDAMVLAAKYFVRGELPGIEGLHRTIGNKERSLWRDKLGHLGPGLERLEGYVFYATLYQRSPELIDKIPFDTKGDFPSPELDQMFRKIAWQAVINHPYSGVRDQDGDGVNDSAEEPAKNSASEKPNASQVQPPSKALIDRYQLDETFYQKHLDADGLPILASKKVSDFALFEAKWIIDQMLQGRNDIRQAINSKRIRVVIMSPEEMTTDVPEHSDLTPAAYWDKRARGLGATNRRPAISCGEENLLEYRGDPYRTENILVHEFAHVIHQHGLATLDPDFNQKLRRVFDAAMEKGLWKEKYAASNPSEYFAEAVQSWFGTNRENDHDHNHVNTRPELKEYDPGISAVMQSTFRDNDWQYAFPSKRTEGLKHLEGYDRSQAPAFRWPAEVSKAYEEHGRNNPGKN